MINKMLSSSFLRRFVVSVSLTGLGVVIVGCETTPKSSASADQDMTQHVGRYDPPPAGFERVRLGVPPFEVDTRRGAQEEMNVIAADILASLTTNARRFRVIERTQLEQLTREQGLEGIVKWDELAEMGQVQGVDYLLLGRVTNFRVMPSESRGGLGVGTIRLPGGGGTGGFDFRNRSSRIDVECGVDLRLVDPESGEVIAANFSEYERSDSISSFGISILGVDADSEADLEISESDQGRILRLALDDALRKMLPDIDYELMDRRREGS
ncbi:MAG: hypothetical protein JJT75_11150 [Opitutales bacterium]|nr:hypothetical protein [Opitutales bacterium]